LDALRLPATEVFTPYEFPLWTYVAREQDFDRQVLNALRTPNIIISVSGPSKSGKSVLLQKVIGKDTLIHIFGPQIRAADDVWTAVLDWIEMPTSTTEQTTQTSTTTTAVGGQASLSLPGGMLRVGGKTDSSDASAMARARTVTEGRTGLKQVQREIANSDFVVFIDDFHYMARELQIEVAKQLKAAAELGIKICTASVPHRSDDMVRANPELRGRVQSVDMDYWNLRELEQIGASGFPRLNVSVDDGFITRLAVEACGSPQLMQTLCLQTCYRLDVFETLAETKAFAMGAPDVARITEAASTLSEFSTVVEQMHGGPKKRGQERLEHAFTDGTTGDVYRAVLLAIASDPPTMSLPYAELMARVGKVCIARAPVGSSVSEACIQISKIASRSVEQGSSVGQAPVEWDTTAAVENLHVTEPYFLFYLRSSPKLKRLGAAP
jgi:hypothetical protein